MNFTCIKETCLYSSDLERAEKFYSSVLGLHCIGNVQGRHVFFRAGNSVLLIFNPEATKNEDTLPPHSGSGETHLAFEISSDNYEKAKHSLEQNGIKILQEQTWKHGLKSFYFRDPDGHLLEITEPGIWGF